MVIKLNQNSPVIDEQINTWLPDSIYDRARITDIDDNYIYLDNFTFMDFTVYRYVTGTVVATPNRKLRTDEYLPIFEDDYIWYTFPHKLWSWDNKDIVEKTYKCLRVSSSYLGDYEGLSIRLYDGGTSLDNYEYFKKV
jgi:hypothetical protein